MKSLAIITTFTTMFCFASVLSNAETGHDHQKVGGPKGGRLLENTQPRAEFLVEKDNRVTITFYDDTLKPVSATDQSVTVVAEAEGQKTNVEFEKNGDVLVSKEALPATHALNIVVQFRQTPDSKPMNFRFVLEDHICGVCKRAEYACICGH